MADIKRYDFKSGLGVEFEILNLSDLYKSNREIITSPHRTGFYHILWFQRGKAEHLVDFVPVKIQSGSVLFLNKDTVQRFDKNGAYDGKAILFTDSFFCRTDADTKFLRNSMLFNDLFPISQLQVKKIAPLFDDLFRLMQTELTTQKDQYQSDILQSFLYNLLLLSEREKRKQHTVEVKKSADLDYVMLFKDLLDQHYKTQKQVSVFAEQLRVSEKRLNLATSKILGKSPKELIDERVLLEAKRLLAHTHESVKEIGFLLGFDEPTNFIKYFRKHAHTTPVEFREHFLSA